MRLAQKIILETFANDLTQLDGYRENYKTYLNTFDYYQSLTKIEKKIMVEKIAIDNPSLNYRTIQNNFGKLLTAKKNGLSLFKYSSFVAIVKANYDLNKGTFAIKKKPAVVNNGLAKFIPSEHKGQAEIDRIKSDPKFIEFITYIKSKK